MPGSPGGFRSEPVAGFSLYGSALRLAADAPCAVPLEAAYAMATDWTALEMRAVRAGAEVSRLSDGQGRAWTVRGHFRGAHHEVRLELADMRTNESVTVHGAGTRFDFQHRTLFVAQGAQGCRLRWDVSVSPRSISGRLMLRGMKLTRGRLQRRLAGGLERFVERMEADYSAGSGAPRTGAAG